jgi:hypothetical protein
MFGCVTTGRPFEDVGEFRCVLMRVDVSEMAMLAGLVWRMEVLELLE